MRSITSRSTGRTSRSHTFNGQSYAPDTYARIFRTTADVITHLQQGKITHHITDEDIRDQTGVDPPTVLRLVNEGKAGLASFMAVVDSLGMPVNGIYDPWEVTIDDWRAEAVDCGRDLIPSIGRFS